MRLLRTYIVDLIQLVDLVQVVDLVQLVDLVRLVQLVHLISCNYCVPSVHGRMQFLGKCRSLILNSESTGEL